MKKLLLLMLGLSIAIGASAAMQSIVVTKTDGSKVEITITDATKIKFAEGNITFGDQSFPRSEVSMWSYSANTGVSSVKVDASRLFTQAGSELTFKVNANVMVFAVDGRLVVANPTVQAGSVVSLGNLANGVYIIKVNNASYKIVKK